jgi:signal transduction histidine kinase
LFLKHINRIKVKQMSSPPRANILIVEDEPIIAMDIRQQLIASGYTVAGLADRAETALEMVALAQPDLVLMDINLHGEPAGIAAAAQIRETFHLPTVFLTSYSEQHIFEQANATNPFGYLIKPFQPQVMKAAIEIALKQYRAEVTIQDAMDEVNKLSETKSQFVSLVAHEFRNPLSAILLALDLLERQSLPQLQEKSLVYVQRARTAAMSMRRLLDEVLVFGEVEHGKLQCHPSPLDVAAFCRDLAEQFQISIAHDHMILCNIQQNIAEGSGLYNLDGNLLSHILTNLLSNAAKYSPKASTIQLSVNRLETDLVFCVQDEGIGIPLENQVRVFDLFYRCSNAKMFKGSGLGLTITKQCVEAHGGTITFHSRVGIGTNFVVTLPGTFNQ